MNKTFQRLLIICLVILPAVAFATTGGDSTFTQVYTQISGYLSGSLGKVFVILGFLGAVAAIAGFASMKVMFPVFGLTIALKFGPNIIDSIMGTSGVYNLGLHHVDNFTILDLLVLMLAVLVFVVGYIKHKHNNDNGKLKNE